MDEQNKIQKLLDDQGIQIKDEELKEMLVKMQHLTEIWLDALEKQIFEGKTLEELLVESNI
jgi:hypothetical protein